MRCGTQPHAIEIAAIAVPNSIPSRPTITGLSHQRSIPGRQRRILYVWSALLRGTLFILVFLQITSCSTNTDRPVSSSTVVLPTPTSHPTEDISEIPVPAIGGSGLPDLDSTSTDEIDCEDAETLCELGDAICDDVADYCDYGPDGAELPDEFDWDN